MEVTNRFKVLDLIERVPEELWTEVRDIVQEGGRDQDHPQEKEMRKRQNGCLRRPYKQLSKEAKGKGEKERYSHLNAEFQRRARRDKKAFLSDQCKEIEENNRMGKTRDLFWRRQWQPTPVFLPGESRDRGAWQAIVHGVARVGHSKGGWGGLLDHAYLAVSLLGWG